MSGSGAAEPGLEGLRMGGGGSEVQEREPVGIRGWVKEEWTRSHGRETGPDLICSRTEEETRD